MSQSPDARQGARLPTDVVIDSRDLAPVLFEGQSRPVQPFLYYRGDQLVTCRLGERKAHFRTQTGYAQPKADAHEPPLLFHLGVDPSEKRNVAADHTDVVEAILRAVKAHQAGVVPGEPQLSGCAGRGESPRSPTCTVAVTLAVRRRSG